MAKLPQATGPTPFLARQPTHLPFVDAPSEPNVTVHDALHESIPGAHSFYGSASEMMHCFKFPFQLLSLLPLHLFLLLTVLGCGVGWQR